MADRWKVNRCLAQFRTSALFWLPESRSVEQPGDSLPSSDKCKCGMPPPSQLPDDIYATASTSDGEQPPVNAFGVYVKSQFARNGNANENTMRKTHGTCALLENHIFSQQSMRRHWTSAACRNWPLWFLGRKWIRPRCLLYLVVCQALYKIDLQAE